MVGLIIAIFTFNIVAFKTNKTLSLNEIAHIWCFTIAFQVVFDTYVDVKYHGYWYFDKEVDWSSLPALVLLVPPVNTMFLNWYPFKATLGKKIRYFFYWELVLLGYELLSLLPNPWGHFHYGWWNLGYSVALNPILLLILVAYFKRFIIQN